MYCMYFCREFLVSTGSYSFSHFKSPCGSIQLKAETKKKFEIRDFEKTKVKYLDFIFKGTWQWSGFTGVFCRNWFLMSPLHYLLSRADFGFEVVEIFVFEKRLPAITDTGSRRLRVAVIRGVTNFLHHCAESPTPRITDAWSLRHPASLIWRVGYWIF